MSCASHAFQHQHSSRNTICILHPHLLLTQGALHRVQYLLELLLHLSRLKMGRLSQILVTFHVFSPCFPSVSSCFMDLPRISPHILMRPLRPRPFRPAWTCICSTAAFVVLLRASCSFVRFSAMVRWSSERCKIWPPSCWAVASKPRRVSHGAPHRGSALQALHLRLVATAPQRHLLPHQQELLIQLLVHLSDIVCA